MENGKCANKSKVFLKIPGGRKEIKMKSNRKNFPFACKNLFGEWDCILGNF
jgi:hypothetical protein